MPEGSDEADHSPARSLWGKPTFLASAAFVAFIVIVLVVVLVVGHRGHGGSRHQGRAAGPAPTSTRRPAGPAPTTVPDSPPGHVTWRLYHTVALPYSATAGPRHVTPSTATGFAHTPTGALLAAVQISYRSLIAPNWKSVVKAQVMPGSGRKAYVAKRSSVADVTVSPGDLGQVAGFKFVNYTPHVATIQILTRFPSGDLQVTTTTMQWRGDDWKEQLQPNGSESPNAHAVQSAAGFVQWGGV